MSYDHWKTTEPRDDTPWQECSACAHRDAMSRMWIDEHGSWLCEDCIIEADEDAAEREDDPCEAAS